MPRQTCRSTGVELRRRFPVPFPGTTSELEAPVRLHGVMEVTQPGHVGQRRRAPFGIGGLPLMIKIELPVSPGLGKAYRSVRSRRASPLGNAESGKEKWCEMGQPLIRSGNNEPELEQRPVAQQNDLVEYLKGI